MNLASSSSVDEESRPVRSAATAGEVRSVESVEQVELAMLVHHRLAVDESVSLEEAYQIFREEDVEFLAVLKAGKFRGMLGRSRLGFLLGSRFGFSLYSHSAVVQFVLPAPLVVSEGHPVKGLLDEVFGRQGDSFFEDVVLVDVEGRLIGLLNMETLARLQTRLVAEQMAKLERQQAALREQNLTLFRTNSALRQQRGLSQGLFESDALGVALLDGWGAVVLHNRRFAELMGQPDRSFEGCVLTEWVVPVERPEFGGILRSFERGLPRREPARETMMQVPDRGLRRFRITMGWIRETGQVCAGFDDITEQRTIEQAMMRREKQNLLDTLVGGIAHELNNKLTPVLAFAELLREQVDASLVFHTESIRTSGEEAAKIIRQLLQFSRPTEQAVELVDLGRLVEDSLPMMRITTRGHCAIVVQQSASKVQVMADPGQVKQVLMNFVINARHAVEGVARPQIELAVDVVEGMAELRVKDNGCGISPEILHRIFDPFFTTKGPDQGSGLGLSVSFSIARQHGGEIVVRSAPGEGAEFVLKLPLQTAMALPWDAESIGRIETRGLKDLNSPRRRVLVVEDEDVVRGLLQEMLRSKFGCDVEMAVNGRQGLEAVRRGVFDLVISDIRMAEMNGLEFYEALRGERPTLADRFIFVTGYAGVGAVPGRQLPVGVPVLGKPFGVRDFEEMCEPYLLDRAAV